MTTRRFVLLSLILCISIANADEKPFVAWLIYPHIANSPVLEVWRFSYGSVWRFNKNDKSQIAEIKEPPLTPGYTFNYGECKINHQLRNDMIAMVKHTDGREWSEQVLNIWIADPAAKSFTKTSGEGVSCRNESYGI